MLLLIITFVLAVSLRSEFVYFLFGFEIILCVFSVFLVRWQSKKVRMRIVLDSQTAIQGETFRVRARLTNDSFLPVTRVFARLAVRAFPDEEEMLMTGKVMLAPYESGDICFELDSSHIQSVDIRAERLVIYDYLGIAKSVCHVNMEDRYAVYVFPDPSKISAVVADPEEYAGTYQVEDGTSSRQGENEMDISEIRQYKFGDAVKLVHWKLSARLDDIMVRTLSDPTEKYMWIFADLQDKGDSPEKRNPDMWDTFAENVSGTSLTLLKADKRHAVCFVDVQEEKVADYSVYDDISYQKMMMALLRAHTYKAGEYTQLLEEIYSDETKGTCIEIDLQGHIVRSGGAG